MAERNFLTAKELAVVASEYDLGAVRSSRPVRAGTVNTNHKLSTSSGDFFVRVNEDKTREDVEYEAAVVAAMVERGLPVPRILPTTNGAQLATVSDRLVTVMPWVAGHHRTSATAIPDELAVVGATLARFHLAGLQIQKRLSRLSGYRTACIDERLHKLAASPRVAQDASLRGVVATLEAESDWLRSHQQQRDAAPIGVVHGDLFPDNLLFDDNGEVAAVLDFEQAASGSVIYDLAVVLSSWCVEDGALAKAKVASLFSGYQSVRLLTNAEIGLLSLEGRAAAYRFSVTRITDVYLPGLERDGKDYRETLGWLQLWKTVTDEDFAF